MQKQANILTSQKIYLPSHSFMIRNCKLLFACAKSLTMTWGTYIVDGTPLKPGAVISSFNFSRKLMELCAMKALSECLQTQIKIFIKTQYEKQWGSTKPYLNIISNAWRGESRLHATLRHSSRQSCWAWFTAFSSAITLEMNDKVDILLCCSCCCCCCCCCFCCCCFC